MPKHSKSSVRRPAKLRASIASTSRPPSDIRVPTRWVKFVIGLALLPVAWVLTKTFFGALAWAAIEQNLWASEPFWFFALGAILFLTAFFFLPLPVKLYVFGHEITHAIWVLLMGGKVQKIEFEAHGGHILADRINTWIALAPYFFPFYSVLLLVGFGFAQLWVDTAPFSRWLYGGLGATWAYHFAYTCWMIPKGQSDLDYGGHVFSLVIIYLANVLILSALLVLSSPEIPPLLFLHELLLNAADFSHWLLSALDNLW